MSRYIKKIFAASYTAYAVDNSGSVWSWGQGWYGQLGNGSENTSYTPVQVTGLNDPVSISGSEQAILAVAPNGNVYGWGYDGYTGVLANVNYATIPTLITSLSNIKQVSLGYYSAMAVSISGAGYIWGDANYTGQATGNITNDGYTPQMFAASGIEEVQYGSLFGMYRKSDGTVWAFGRNQEGQLGNNSYTNSILPVQVSGVTSATKITVGSWNAYAFQSATLLISSGGGSGPIGCNPGTPGSSGSVSGRT